MMEKYATITVKFKDQTDIDLDDVVDAIEALSDELIVSEASWDEV